MSPNIVPVHAIISQDCVTDDLFYGVYYTDLVKLKYPTKLNIDNPDNIELMLYNLHYYKDMEKNTKFPAIITNFDDHITVEGGHKLAWVLVSKDPRYVPSLRDLFQLNV